MHEKSNTLAIVSVIGLIIIIIVMATANKPVVNVGSETQRDKLSVSGNAELTVSPDEATIHLNILTDADTAKQAQDNNKEISNKVIAALKKAGIKEANIETTNYFLHKRTEWDSDSRKSVEVGYRLTHTLKVTTTDIEDVGKLTDTAVSAGANGVDRITFGLTKETEQEVRDQALEKASLAAKEKAKSIASTVGVKLGTISSIQESNYNYLPFEYSPRVTMELAEAAAGDSKIAPKKVEVRSTISLVFNIN
jgi:uncharacterized protein YggE